MCWRHSALPLPRCPACLPACRWNERYIEAKLSLDDRAAKLDAVAELVEKDLILLGCTAIEDKLQEGVPQTIKTLAEAGIRLWVLTGDKMVSVLSVPQHSSVFVCVYLPGLHSFTLYGNKGLSNWAPSPPSQGKQGRAAPLAAAR